MRSTSKAVQDALHKGLNSSAAPASSDMKHLDSRCDDTNKYKKHSIPFEFKKRNTYMTPEMSRKYFNRDGASAKETYSLYSGILCLKSLNFPESSFLPDWWTGMKTVTVERGQVGLVKIDGRLDFLAAGTYRLPSSVWVGQRSVTESFKHESYRWPLCLRHPVISNIWSSFFRLEYTSLGRRYYT